MRQALQSVSWVALALTVLPSILYFWGSMELDTVKGMMLAAKALASLGVDLFTDPELLTAARKDFEQRKGDYVFKSPLDPEMKRPMGLDGIEHNLHEGRDQHLDQLAQEADGDK